MNTGEQMRRTGLALATALLITASTAACSTDTATGRPGGADSGATGTRSPEAPAPVSVGTTITKDLGKDLGDGSKFAYTVKRVIDPARPTAKSQDQLKPGTRWIGVELSFSNVGSTFVEESPWRTQLLPPGDGEPLQAAAWLDHEIVDGPAVPYFMKLRPGQSAEGFFVFELPEHTKFDRVQYTLLGNESIKLRWTAN
ncbi:hypothetical protein [Streptomyces sp. NPDC088400]|uniref:hypothetical protein n=1 Tax=Streptomyces sp. NPDC088400 TaxID=3365861 RepID=UPI0037FC2487